jgi:hypothetical protein
MENALQWRFLRYFLLSVCALVLAPKAFGDPVNWTFTLTNADQSGGPGSALIYDGTITNSTGSDLILDTAKINFETSVQSGFYVKDFSDNFLATLGIIPTSGYSGPIFFIQWNPSVTAGARGTGSLALTAETPASPVSYAPAFSAEVSATTVPEPETWSYVLAGFLLLSAIGHRIHSGARQG